jgi:hypothetical protein
MTLSGENAGKRNYNKENMYMLFPCADGSRRKHLTCSSNCTFHIIVAFPLSYSDMYLALGADSAESAGENARIKGSLDGFCHYALLPDRSLGTF